MLSRLNSTPVRYGLLLVSCLLVASFPWVLSMITSPLPVDLQRTGTILAITRTARLDPQLALTLIEAMGFTTTPSFTPTFTITPTPTNTPTSTSTATQVPTATRTPTKTLTPTPVVYVTALDEINTYSCPGSDNKVGTLEAGTIFTILGWDQTIEDDHTLYWILIEDEVDQPQKWVRESEFLDILFPDYKDFVLRAACRRSL